MHNVKFCPITVIEAMRACLFVITHKRQLRFHLSTFYIAQVHGYVVHGTAACKAARYCQLATAAAGVSTWKASMGEAGKASRPVAMLA